MRTVGLYWEKASTIITPQVNAAGVHVWPFDHFFPIEVRFFDVADAHQIRMNRHNYCELLYVYRGKTDLQVQDRHFQVSAGDLIVIGSDLYHHVYSNPGVKLVVLYFDPAVIRSSGATGEDVQYLMPFLLQGSDFPHVVTPDTGIPAEALALMQRMNAELPAVSNRARLAVKTYLKMALMLLVNHYAAYLDTRETFDLRQEAIERLRPLFKYLEENYQKPIRVWEAARVCAMSSSYLMCFFKQVTGQSFHGYLNHFRIAKAQALLATTNKSISEIGQETGYCDQSHFGMVFRKLVGLTPLAYRRRSVKAELPGPRPLIAPQTRSTAVTKAPALTSGNNRSNRTLRVAAHERPFNGRSGGTDRAGR